MIVSRAAIVGILLASSVFIGGQTYATFISQPITVGSITITTASALPDTPPVQNTLRLAAQADTELYQHSPEKNAGRKRQINVISRADWNARILIRYDLSVLPVDATIQSCTLHMYLSEASNFGSREHGIFHIAQHAADWSEGDHLFSTSSPGESSWLWYSRSKEWDEFGGDAAQEPTAVTATGTSNQVWKEWDLTPDCQSGGIQSWLLRDIQEDNPHYTIRTEYQTRESYYEDQQPYLAVSYTIPEAH